VSQLCSPQSKSVMAHLINGAYHFHSHAWEFIYVDGINALFAAHRHHKLCTAEVQYSVLNKPHSQNNYLLMDIVFYSLIC